MLGVGHMGTAPRNMAALNYVLCLCKILNPVGFLSPSGLDCGLDCGPPYSPLPPHTFTDSTELSLVISPSSDTVTIYSTVLLVCVAFGDPLPYITWEFDGSVINNETSLRVSNRTTTPCTTC